MVNLSWGGAARLEEVIPTDEDGEMEEDDIPTDEAGVLAPDEFMTLAEPDDGDTPLPDEPGNPWLEARDAPALDGSLDVDPPMEVAADALLEPPMADGTGVLEDAARDDDGSGAAELDRLPPLDDVPAPSRHTPTSHTCVRAQSLLELHWETHAPSSSRV